ncbi:PLAT/LH2 domain-containing protein [Streptomyces sp. NPDC005549]|uniref:PLAT/LH2 domain-containing protein n=1 Tax=Streptomyces sp. NPDC005549 TaxID=3154888 RepID=UPI0033BA332F
MLKAATGKDYGAGTDATLQAQLSCQDGKVQSTMQTLDISSYNDFERGDEDEYKIFVPQDCTQPTGVSFQMVGGSELDGAAWQFLKVTVWKDVPEAQRTYYYGGEGSHGETGQWIDPVTVDGDHRFINVPLRDTF